MKFAPPVLLLCCLAAEVSAQTRLPPGVRGPGNGMATRSVSAFLVLERRLDDALRRGDRGAVDAMIDPQFALRSAASDDDAGADAWRKQAAREAVSGGPGPRNLSVREWDDVAVVSFLLDTSDSRNGATYVVDVWRRSTSTLLMRYESRSRDAAKPPRRPTGRE